MDALNALKSQSAASIQVLPAMAEEEMRLNRRVDALASLGDDLRPDYSKARMAEEVEAGDIDVVTLAAVPYAPAAHRVRAQAGARTLARARARPHASPILLEALNTSVRRPEDLEAVLHVPGLAVIPRISGGSRHGAVPSPRAARRGQGQGRRRGSPMSGDQTFSIGIEAFRNLRTSLIWSDGGEALKTLVVTSAAPGEGKTLTAANLAVTLAYDGLRVLLVDCDIRRPRVHGLFHVPRAPGLMELLTASNAPGASAAFPRSARRRWRGSRCCPAVRCRSNAANLLSGTRMRVLLQELREQFDIIVLDTPPVLATADAGIVASLTDGVLLVVRAGHHRQERRPAGLPAARQRRCARRRNGAERSGWRGREGRRLLLSVRLRGGGAVIGSSMPPQVASSS